MEWQDDAHLRQAAPAEIIDHILQRYHAPLRDELVSLVEMATRVEQVHEAHPACPRGLAAHLRAMAQELLGHLDKEERVLFPMILQGAFAHAVAGPIQRMEMEHDDHADHLRRTRQLTGELQVPEDACNTWRSLYGALRELEAELRAHIQLESQVLFPKALGQDVPQP